MNSQSSREDWTRRRSIGNSPNNRINLNAIRHVSFWQQELHAQVMQIVEEGQIMFQLQYAAMIVLTVLDISLPK